mmetsp:Transcript_17271/g.20578  ORF Transcript_17271/g.20578 Transcript_17271/m.20578 type:complete len:140 (-) Transcript_17271:231-650(-)
MILLSIRSSLLRSAISASSSPILKAPISSSALSLLQHQNRQQPQSKNHSTITRTNPTPLPMKANTPIPGLDFLKNEKAPVSLDRSEYPAWVGEMVSSPPLTLAKLEKMRVEDATDAEQMRYLKLTRRNKIKLDNTITAK